MQCRVDDASSSLADSLSVPHGLWYTLELGSSDVSTAFTGCMEHVLVNGEALSLDAYSRRYSVSVTGEASAGCHGFDRSPSKKDDNSPNQTVIIVICTFFGLALLAIVLAFLFIRMRRVLKDKQALPPNSGVVGFTKVGGGGGGAEQQDMNHIGNDSSRGGVGGGGSRPDFGYGDERNEEAIIQKHIQDELSKRQFNEREVRTSSLSLSRPDIIDQDEMTDRMPEPPPQQQLLNDGGVDNLAYLGELEHYDLDNASSIAPSDVFDIAAHYKQYRKNRYKPHSKPLHHARTTPSPSAMLAHRQSPASVSLARQSPAGLMLERDSNGMLINRSSPHTKSQLTVENVNQLNRQTPVNQLARTTPSPAGMRPNGLTSLRSTPLSGIVALYPSNISSGSFSERNSIPNGNVRGASRPNSKMKPGAVRGTPTKGLTIEEVNRLNARHQSPLGTLDVISSSSDELGKNAINRTDFTHSDLLEPAVGALPPDSSSDDDTNDSFTCSEFESDHEKVRNDASRAFRKLPAVNEHETDSNQESHSTFFTASDDELPRKLAKSKLPGVALGLDYMLNWGPNYEKLVGVFDDIAMLPQPDLVMKPLRPSSGASSRPASSSSNQRPASSSSNRPPSRLAPQPVFVPDVNDRLTSRHSSASPAVPPPYPSSHVKQPSLVSLASSHDRQSSLSSLHSSRSGHHLPISPLANGVHAARMPNGVSHSRSSSKSSLSSRPSYQPPPQYTSASASPVHLPAREEYV